MDYLDKIFLWLGVTSKSQEQFDEYFELDYSEDIDNRKICGFCKDIGKKWYDEDFIGYLRFNEELTVLAILKEVPISENDKNKVLDNCKDLGIEFVNSVYWYSGEIEVPSKDKKYNELFYIGEYSLD
ncbi:immunity 22 family protein [Flavobacterium sp. N502540]|uniref:immunity 22 family protein n=1 Tax=Flavobacterium sp. N502540 TaxID=2986838 RepID=UPI0022242CE6|nr:immunity 22 family protein [Flavobacterium sp. N502540]